MRTTHEVRTSSTSWVLTLQARALTTVLGGGALPIAEEMICQTHFKE
jgi:hypothetical protein